MDIKKLFKNQNSIPEPDLKLEKILLNQLAIYAIEGDTDRFDNLIEKIYTFLDYYSVHETYILNSDGRDGRLTEVSIEDIKSYIEILKEHKIFAIAPDDYDDVSLENHLISILPDKNKKMKIK